MRSRYVLLTSWKLYTLMRSRYMPHQLKAVYLNEITLMALTNWKLYILVRSRYMPLTNYFVWWDILRTSIDSKLWFVIHVKLALYSTDVNQNEIPPATVPVDTSTKFHRNSSCSFGDHILWRADTQPPHYASLLCRERIRGITVRPISVSRLEVVVASSRCVVIVYPDSPSPSSQKSVIGHYPGLSQSISHPRTLFKINFNIIFPSTSNLARGVCSWFAPVKILYKFCFCHACYISVSFLICLHKA
jgi:hypothetical protein